ncbi:hypothetical protein G3M48_006063 [Beauveria asiatica]|uniref:Uncharacterized protein n=1 Tax=Beauveria asiatica TaxID=1069075 RepID=A0AAW0RQG2_9HYPO
MILFKYFLADEAPTIERLARENAAQIPDRLSSVTRIICYIQQNSDYHGRLDDDNNNSGIFCLGVGGGAAVPVSPKEAEEDQFE